MNGRGRLAGGPRCALVAAPGLGAGRPGQEAGGAAAPQRPAVDWPLRIAFVLVDGGEGRRAAARFRLGTVEGRSDGGRRTGDDGRGSVGNGVGGRRGAY